MKRLAIGFLFAFGYTNAAEKYILQYDNATWQNLHLNSLPDSTSNVLQYLQMVVAELTSDELLMYQSIPGIKIHKNELVYMYGSVQDNPKNWGIDRIDQRNLPLDNKFHYGTEGEGVDVYVLDCGVSVSHDEFEGRASFVGNYIGDGMNYDCQGHGTYVSSIIAGKNVGVAKKANIKALKILSCDGSGGVDKALSAFNYVARAKTQNPNQKIVLNLSAGAHGIQALNDAAEAAVSAGVVVVTAAGNNQDDACQYSPGSADNVITVAASDQNDNHYPLSNYGSCVHIYAPGVDIYGAWAPDGDEGYRMLRGTSGAAPHVAGIAALILSSGQARTPAEVKAKLLQMATSNVLNPLGQFN